MCATCNAESLGSNPNPAASQCFHRKRESKAVFTNPVFLWHFYITKHNTMRIAATDAQFIFFGTHIDSVPFLFYYQGIYPFTSFGCIGLCYYEVSRSRRSVSNPILSSI